MTQHLYILTGASRGMGLAMARQLLLTGNTLLCISRSANETLAVQAKHAGASLLQWTQDLALGASTSAKLEQWLREQPGSSFDSATLINNAGVIPRIGPLSEADADDLGHALRVGLESPMQLTSAFYAPPPVGPVNARCSIFRQVWGAEQWHHKRATALPKQGWTISPAVWRWKKRLNPRVPRFARWRPA